MYCISCQHFKESCELESIYASGYLKDCPFLGKAEPIITATGANYQIMTEIIRNPEGRERVEVIPKKYPGHRGWYGTMLLCFEGKGLVVRSHFSETLPLGAIWFAWQDVLKEILALNHEGLNKLIPLIHKRIALDYSVVEYRSIMNREKLIIMEEVKTAVKKKILFTPVNDENLLDVNTPDNKGKDQMDLFAC